MEAREMPPKKKWLRQTKIGGWARQDLNLRPSGYEPDAPPD